MKTTIRRLFCACVLSLLLAPFAPAMAADTYDIHVIVPLTGGASFVGLGQQDVLNALAAEINKTGGVHGKPLRFVFGDDQTSPQVAVQLTTDVLAGKPAPVVIMGSSLVGMCLAMAPLVADNGPVQYCLSPAIHPKAGGYVFSASSSSIDQIAAVVRYYRMKGWTKLATLMSTDGSGQDGDRAVDTVLAYPENASMTKVDVEHFNPGDVSVSAQIANIKASGAQAMIAWTTGQPAATVFKGMVQDGLDIPVAPTSGNQTFAAMAQWTDFLPKQLVLASALYPEHAGVLKLDPRIEKKQQEMYAILKARNLRADNQVATSWDAGLIVVAGLRQLPPNATATQLRDFIVNLKDFAGVDGVYDFTKYPERGLGPDGSTVTTYDVATKSWKWLSKPGGEPLSK